MPGSMGSGPTGQPQFPEITTFLATKYGNTFKAANKDQSGDIPGGEVLRMLGPVPVDIAVKKEAWDLVAGAFSHHNCRELYSSISSSHFEYQVPHHLVCHMTELQSC